MRLFDSAELDEVVTDRYDLFYKVIPEEISLVDVLFVYPGDTENVVLYENP